MMLHPASSHAFLCFNPPPPPLGVAFPSLRPPHPGNCVSLPDEPSFFPQGLADPDPRVPRHLRLSTCVQSKKSESQLRRKEKKTKNIFPTSRYLASHLYKNTAREARRSVSWCAVQNYSSRLTRVRSRLVDDLELVEDGLGELEGRGLAAHVAGEELAATGVKLAESSD